MNRPLPTANAHQLNILRAKQDVILSAFNEVNNLITKVESEILNIIREQDLLDDGMELAQIAQTLWYSDQAAFTRAYKKWHGVTPSRREQ